MNKISIWLSGHIFNRKYNLFSSYSNTIRCMVLLIALNLLALVSQAQRVNLRANNESLVNVIKQLREQTDYAFVFDAELLRVAKPVTLRLSNVSLEQALNHIFKGQQLNYVVHDRTITLQPKVIGRRDENRDGQRNPTQTKPIVNASLIGTVIDAKTKLPLADVNVQLDGVTHQVKTDDEGHFQFVTGQKLPLKLRVSFVGYETKVLIVDSSPVQIELRLSVENLDEIVVVGYGTQRKKNLAGSVSVVSSDRLTGRINTNITSSLAGEIPGLQVQSTSGQPGRQNSNLLIRGVGTLNNASPLVIIDGIIGDINAVNPNDVESISVLKDASSGAIYGAQAANGVILITTKQGKSGQSRISLNTFYGWNKAINVPEMVSNYADYMALVNRSATNIGQTGRFPSAEIERWQNAERDPQGFNEEGQRNDIAYPNTNWADFLFRTKTTQNYAVSANGGSEKTQYNLSSRYVKDNGIVDNSGLEKFDIRTNITSKIKPFLRVGTQTYFYVDQYGVGRINDMLTYLGSTSPGITPVYEGKYGGPESAYENPQLNNPYYTLKSKGGQDILSNLSTTWFAHIDIWKGLKLESRVNYGFREEEISAYPQVADLYRFSTNSIVREKDNLSNLITSRSYAKSYSLTFDNILRYDKQWDDGNSIDALLGYNEYYYHYYDFTASRKGLIDETITELGSATEVNNVSGDEYDHALRSFFARLNYSYKDRYIIETNLRRDGSSRFGSDKRWGYFPSVAAAWNISREEFFSDILRYVPSLKLRASWGKLGNDAAGNYDHLAAYKSVNYSLGGSAVTGLTQKKLANSLLQWEGVSMTNLGLDLSLWQNRLDVNLDLYHKKTNGILTALPIYLTNGKIEAPTVNGAGIVNKGVELGIKLKEFRTPLKYQVGLNFNYNKNNVTNYKGRLQQQWNGEQFINNIEDVSSGSLERVLEGYPVNSYNLLSVYRGNGNYYLANGDIDVHGGPKDGMIRSEEDLSWVKAMQVKGYSFAPVNTVGASQLYYGDFIYADKNDDGIYGNVHDYTVRTKSRIPSLNVGLQLNFQWKNFDLGMLWTSSLGHHLYWYETAYNSTRLGNGTAISKRIADDAYYYNVQDPDDGANNLSATYPRLKFQTDNINSVNSDFWLYNASFVKLKNAQLGYSFPQLAIKRAGLSNLRVGLNAENLLLFTDFPGIDPEIGASVSYPTMRQIAFNVSFNF